MSTTDTLTMNRILNAVAERQATDIHFVVGNHPFLRIKGALQPLEEEELITPETMAGIVNFFVPEEQLEVVGQKKELKFIYDWLGKARFRVHIFQQKGHFSVSLKIIGQQIKPLAELGLPKIVESFIAEPKGLIFIAGPFNSGRSTTLNSMIQAINQTRAEHILYLEEPIEYLFVNSKSVIEQRQVGLDVKSFTDGLISAKDEDVDVVAVAKVDSPQSLELLLELAESGRLVIAILDYDTTVSALDGLVSEFSDAKVSWARNVLADFLVGLIVQRLVKTVDGEMALAAEILTASSSAQALIKEGRLNQLESIIQTSKAEGMVSLDRSLADLAKNGRITSEEAVKNAINPKTVKTLLSK